MPVSRGRRSSSVAKRPFPGVRVLGRATDAPQWARHTGLGAKIGPARKKYLCKLLSDLMTIIDEEGKFSTEDGAINTDEVDSEPRNDTEEFEKNEKSHVKSVDTPQGKEIKGNEKDNKPKNVTHFLELCETHVQLTHNIRGLLNALGGGGRAANAVGQMNDAIAETRNAFTITITNGTTPSGMFSSIEVAVQSCTQSLSIYSKAAKEMDETFRELGFFNSDFFNALQRIRYQAELVSVKLDADYGNLWYCGVDRFLDNLFEPLVQDLDTFISRLQNVAEKEISALRQGQDFLSQRYLNLTTIATFLSSVTATTLQITADDGDTGPLTLVTSAMWFISLVFSTSSAVYSLLVMTWRQSSVRQPESVLPVSFRVWLRNGPMYALIASLMTFSIGLCLLAFRVGDQKGLQASAAIPTAFAGIHAYVILVLSVWFLLEQWRGKHAEKWRKIRDVYLIPLQRTCGRLFSAKKLAAAAKQRLLDSISMFSSLPLSHIARRAFKGGDPAPRTATGDVELGETVATRSANSAPGRYVSAPPAHIAADDLAHEHPPHETLDQFVDVPSAAEATALESSLLIIVETGVISEDKSGSNADERSGEKPAYKPLENLLQFSPYGSFLGFARKCTVTIYGGNKSFSVLTTFDTPDKDEVKEISWSPIYFGYKLLVRSVTSVSIWEVSAVMEPLVAMVGHLREAVTSARWTIWEGSDEDKEEGFVCSSGLSVKLFDKECKEVWSVGIAEVRGTTRVLDVSLIRKNYLFCLAQVPDDVRCSHLLLIDVKDGSIQSEHEAARGHTSIAVSLASKVILFFGDGDGAEIANLSISESGAHLDIIAEIRTIWDRTWGANELTIPEGTVVFHGGGDKLICGYSYGEIATLYRKPDDGLLSALHRFTTPTAGPMPEKPLSFAINNSRPYMFAFSDEQGFVTIWSIQSNVGLDDCPTARTFDVHDRPGVRFCEPTISTGKFLILPPPAIP